MPALVCKHCQKSNVNRPRGLCWSCYYTPGVREMYPAASTNVPPAEKGLKPPPATTAPAGTTEKVKELARRLAECEDLWHPEDGPNQEGR